MTKISRKNEKIKAILFDMDGVVINSMPYHAESWVNIFSGLGIDISENDILLKEGIKPSDLIVETFLESGLGELSETEISRILKLKVDYFWEKYKPLPYPEAIDCFNELTKQGYRLAIVSGSTHKSVSKVMKDFSLADYFEVIIHSDIISRGKPHPMSYLKAMELMDLSPEDCICVENAPYGIRSARSAGIHTLALTTTLDAKTLLESGANNVIHNHSQILSFLNGEF